MESINEGIRAGMRPSAMPQENHLPTARDIMATDLIVFRPTDSIRTVIIALLKHRISGAPVVSEACELVGVISEMDCLRVVASGAYDAQPFEPGRLVQDLMTRDVMTVGPSADIYAIADIFLSNKIRRLPVVEGQRVVGQVSRRDVLRAVEKTY
jgi:CBS domain-containing protein